ncbi:MFS transporter [Bowdeniella nasicola]|uniref:MFS transporter n=1 Tax=Bowdeniella nasicola TaxID=208480 RepID=UPI001FE5BC03|nr:MFS transporter [Bowdeniella nasicola]
MLVLPRVLDSVPDRPVMLAGDLALPAALAAIAAVLAAFGTDVSWPLLLALWTVPGAANALVLTPSARLLRRASTEETRPAVFAAQFSLSHACFLLTYPIAGTLGARLGLATTAGILAAIGAIAFLAATALWKEPRAVQNA